MSDWPKQPVRWIEGRTLYVSVPFTWNLPALADELRQRSMEWDRVVVGGPAVKLMPEIMRNISTVTVGGDMMGVLQRVNPRATRTTLGCVRRCRFCGIGQQKIEPGGLVELEDWPDLPIVCDNNLLAASMGHFHKVIDRLIPHGWADFNQGLDARLMTPEHARRLAEIPSGDIRLACDNDGERDQWQRAVEMLRDAGIAKKRIKTYCLIGFADTPKKAWKRCLWIEKEHRMYACPMWFHRLDATKRNAVTAEQTKLGWTRELRIGIMRYFYKHTGDALIEDYED